MNSQRNEAIKELWAFIYEYARHESGDKVDDFVTCAVEIIAELAAMAITATPLFCNADPLEFATAFDKEVRVRIKAIQRRTHQ